MSLIKMRFFRWWFSSGIAWWTAAWGIAAMRTKKEQTVTLHKRSSQITCGPTCIDLFSGAGGFAEGLRQAGWSIRAGSDMDPDAGETFRFNFPEASFFEGPISELRSRSLLRAAGLLAGDLDCLVGGPPCQSFSYNNHQRSAKNARAKLFRDYLRIVKTLRPKTLVMENVPGMLTIDNGRIVDEIKSALQKLKYKCEIRILYAEDFGVPQARRRAFVVASRIVEPSVLFPRGSHGPSLKPSEAANPFVHRWEFPRKRKVVPFVNVGQAIGDLPVLRSGTGKHVSRHRKNAQSEFQRSVRRNMQRLYNHICHDVSHALLTKIAHVPEGGNWSDIPRKLLTPGMRRAKKNCHTKRYGRLLRRGLASTILTKCDPHWGAYIHPTQNRTISVREAARLQGFPDRFRFAGESTHKHYVQVGNAVPIQIAKALGFEIKKQMELVVSRAQQSNKRAA
jgi:DNA (cytosine-5)-methyltransferase 1